MNVEKYHFLAENYLGNQIALFSNACIVMIIDVRTSTGNVPDITVSHGNIFVMGNGTAREGLMKFPAPGPRARACSSARIPLFVYQKVTSVMVFMIALVWMMNFTVTPCQTVPLTAAVFYLF